MSTKKQLLSFLILMLFITTVNANNKNSKKVSFIGKAVITDVQSSLSFFIPEEFQSVYVYVSDSEKKVFQKIKVYQRGNGKIICDKTGLDAGTYYYTIYVDGKAVDTQKLIVKK